jgi:hypothetical protein
VSAALVLAVALLTQDPTLDEPPTMAPVVEEWVVDTADVFTPDPAPEADPPTAPAVVVPDTAALPIELAPAAVQPKPPPPPPVPPPEAAAPAPAAVDPVARAAAAPNGQIPADALCPVWDGSLLRCDAAAALQAAAAAGMPTVGITSAYRSYADQVAVKASRGAWAARPGTSNHGHGVAIDAPEPMRSWLHRYGAAFGWVNPAWARTEKHEPWHFEYGGTS